MLQLFFIRIGYLQNGYVFHLIKGACFHSIVILTENVYWRGTLIVLYVVSIRYQYQRNHCSSKDRIDSLWF